MGYVRNYFPELFHNTGLHLEYKQIQKNIYEFSDFLVNVLDVHDVGATFNAVVTYHDACAALREYGIKEQPRALSIKSMDLGWLRWMKTKFVAVLEVHSP